MRPPFNCTKPAGATSVAAVLSAMFALGGGGAALAAQPAITNLGTLPGGTASYANGVNADGSVVVGGTKIGNSSKFDDHAFRWTAAGGMQDLGKLPGARYFAYANGVSGDGSVVVGESTTDDFVITYRAFRWTAATGMQDMGTLPGGVQAHAYAVSGDGATIVGTSEDPGALPHAFRWTAAGGMQDLGTIPNGAWASAHSVSGDGSVVAGHGLTVPAGGSAADLRAFRWTAAGGMQNLGTLAGGGLFSQGGIISGDGSVVVGSANPPGLGDFALHAFRWTSAGGMQSLGALPGTGNNAQANGVNSDGSVVVGESGARAFLWTAELGLVDLNTYLPTLGVDLTGWELSRAAAISSDGTAIVGSGYFDGAARGWLVTGVPEPAAGLLLLVGGIITTSRRRNGTHWRERARCARVLRPPESL